MDIQYLEPLWGRWWVERLLGEGSFGQVWLVRDAGGHEAAVKEVQVPFANGDLDSARLEGLTLAGAKAYFRTLMEETRREIDLMKALRSCETVVQFLDSQVVERGHEFGWVILILMERLVPFRDRMASGILTVQDAAHLGRDIALALEACAGLGIVHRDIKPDNLFYNPRTDRYQLGDFGVAHYLERPTEEKGRAGTLTHMPPEVFQGATFTPEADLYALGMILYRLLNDSRIPGLPPFPEPFTPVQRSLAVDQRLKGGPVGPPSAIGYAAQGGAPAESLGVRFGDTPDDRRLAAALGDIAWRAIAPRREDRFPGPKQLRLAIELALKT